MEKQVCLITQPWLPITLLSALSILLKNKNKSYILQKKYESFSRDYQ